jgi:long-chain acyl-CoA synthetase
MSSFNLFQEFKKSAKKYEDKTSLIFGTHAVTYKRLLDAAERLAGSLSKLGISRGDRCALMLPNLPQFVICYYALLKLGSWIVPVNTLFKEEEIRYLLEDSEAKGIIALSKDVNLIQKAICGLDSCKIQIYLGDNIPTDVHDLTHLIASSPPMSDDIKINADDPAVVLYTTGTTGRPKGAVLSHGNVMAQIDSIRNAVVLESKDVVSSAVPLFHSFGHTVAMHVPLITGCTVVLYPKFDAQEVAQSLKENQVTVFIGLPTMFRSLSYLNVNKEDFSALRYCISSGAPLLQKVRNKFEEKFGKPILAGYGLTEAGPLVTIQRWEHQRKPDSLGFPVFEVQVKIVDNLNNEVQFNEVGEVLVQGPNVMQGYLNRPAATREVLKDGWLHTGDVGKLDEDGLLYIVDRKKDLILKGGFNVYPREVESVLTAHPKVKECAVIGIEDEIQGEEVKALVVPKQGVSLKKEELSQYCRERLAVFKCPKYIEFVNALPRGTMGKILKRKLREERTPGK